MTQRPSFIILTNSDQLQLMPVNEAIAARAAHLRAIYNLRTPDALQVAAALDANCDAFLTNDRGLKRVEELKILFLDDLEITKSGKEGQGT